MDLGRKHKKVKVGKDQEKTPMGRVSDYDGPDIKLFILIGWDRSLLSVAWSTGLQLVFFFFCSGFQ